MMISSNSPKNERKNKYFILHKFILPALIITFVVALSLLLDSLIPEKTYWTKSEIHPRIIKRCAECHASGITYVTYKSMLEIEKVMITTSLFLSFIFTSFLVSVLGLFLFIINHSKRALFIVASEIMEIYLAFDAIFLLTLGFSLTFLFAVLFGHNTSTILISIIAVIYIFGCFWLSRHNLMRYEDYFKRYSDYLGSEHAELDDEMLRVCFAFISLECFITLLMAIISLIGYLGWYFEQGDLFSILGSTASFMILIIILVKKGFPKATKILAQRLSKIPEGASGTNHL